MSPKPTFLSDHHVFRSRTAKEGEGGGGGGHSLIKAGTDLRARTLGISGVNFCPGIRFWEVNFAWALGFWQFLTKMCNN